MIKVISGNQSFEIENKTTDEVVETIKDQMETEKNSDIAVAVIDSKEKVVIIKENNEISLDKIPKV